MGTSADRAWVKKQLKRLREHSHEIYDAGGRVTNELGPWTALKMTIHAQAVDVYTTVISNYYDDWYYVDALAGSGSIKIKDRDSDVLVGSPIVAAAMAGDDPFSEMYFIEKDADRATALEDRIECACQELPSIQISPEDCYVITDDANEALGEIRSRIKEDRSGRLKGAHTFGYIDNADLNVGIDAIPEDDRLRMDLLVNYQSTNANRSAGKGERSKMERFWGLPFDELEAMTEEERLEAYINALKQKGRAGEETIPVQASSEFPYHYYMIYNTKKEDAGWLNALQNLRERIRALDGDNIDDVLNTMQRDPTNLDSGLFADEDDGVQETLF